MNRHNYLSKRHKDRETESLGYLFLANRNNNLSKRQKDRKTERLGYLFLANRNNNLSIYLREGCSIH
jgi:hypothetical protein